MGVVQDIGKLITQIRVVMLDKGYQRRQEAFMLSSGAYSHDYVDCRKALASGSDLALVAQGVISQAQANSITFELVGGLTMGADPLSHAISIITGLGWFSVRKQAKSHGTSKEIEGSTITPDQKVLLVEDVVTSGSSIIHAYESVVNAGGKVVGAIPLLDRGDKGSKIFSDLGVPYFPLLSYKDLGIDPI